MVKRYIALLTDINIERGKSKSAQIIQLQLFIVLAYIMYILSFRKIVIYNTFE